MQKKNNKDHLVRISFDDSNLARDLFGVGDEHLHSLEQNLGVSIRVKGTDLAVHGEATHVELVERVLRELYELLKKGQPVFGSDIERAVKFLAGDRHSKLQELVEDSIFIPSRNKMIMPKSRGQKKYLEAIRAHDMTFGIGPAGTGKSYLAVAMAIMALTRNEVSRVVMSRPAVEAGEKLGFLPGTLEEKVSPYLRPLYDALHDMLDPDRAQRLIQTGVIEVAPLAFMRGRTLHDAFVILDEAQNTTPEQMKMFLTRLGPGSKAVITGDVTQIDLPPGRASGLVEVRKILGSVKEIAFVEFTGSDVVRHPLVTRILKAYEAVERPFAGGAA